MKIVNKSFSLWRDSGLSNSYKTFLEISINSLSRFIHSIFTAFITTILAFFH